MKVLNIFVCCVLSVIVKGNLLAAAVRGGIEPIILSFGAAFAALGLDSQTNHDVDHFEKKGFIDRLKEFSYNSEAKEQEKPTDPIIGKSNPSHAE